MNLTLKQDVVTRNAEERDFHRILELEKEIFPDLRRGFDVSCLSRIIEADRKNIVVSEKSNVVFAYASVLILDQKFEEKFRAGIHEFSCEFPDEMLRQSSGEKISFIEVIASMSTSKLENFGIMRNTIKRATENAVRIFATPITRSGKRILDSKGFSRISPERSEYGVFVKDLK